MKRLTDPGFRYTPAASTDIRLTFARIRREQKREQEQRAAAEAEAAKKVKPIVRAKP